MNTWSVVCWFPGNNKLHCSKFYINMMNGLRTRVGSRFRSTEYLGQCDIWSGCDLFTVQYVIMECVEFHQRRHIPAVYDRGGLMTRIFSTKPLKR